MPEGSSSYLCHWSRSSWWRKRCCLKSNWNRESRWWRLSQGRRDRYWEG